MKKSLDNTPNHVAIIMDGNGRWAKLKGKSRLFGHKNGIKSVQKIVEYATKTKIKNLTLYAFSTENWNRPKKEIETLMSILIDTLRKEINKMVENNVKFKCIGDISKLPDNVIKELKETIKKTSKNDGNIIDKSITIHHNDFGVVDGIFSGQHSDKSKFCKVRIRMEKYFTKILCTTKIFIILSFITQILDF